MLLLLLIQGRWEHFRDLAWKEQGGDWCKLKAFPIFRSGIWSKREVKHPSTSRVSNGCHHMMFHDVFPFCRAGVGVTSMWRIRPDTPVWWPKQNSVTGIFELKLLPVRPELPLLLFYYPIIIIAVLSILMFELDPPLLFFICNASHYKEVPSGST